MSTALLWGWWKEKEKGTFYFSDRQKVPLFSGRNSQKSRMSPFSPNYVHHPEWEARLCQLLGFLTEEERRTQATLQSAVASKWSAIAAAVSAIIALLALLLAFGFAKGCQTKAQPVAPADRVQPAASQPSVPGG
jgi:hypothetical protein